MKRICLIIMLIISCVSLSACTGAKDNTLRPAPLTKYTPKIQVMPLWSTRVGDGANKFYLRMQPAVSKNVIYTASYNGKICAVCASDGKIIWKTNLRVRLTSGVSVNAGRLFVATEEGQVVGMSAVNGKQLWVTQVGGTILTAPKAYNGIVLAKSMDGSLTALSERDGKLMWRFTQTVPNLILHASSQPHFANGLALAGFANSSVVAVNSWNGKVVWLQKLVQPTGVTDVENMADIDANLVVVSGVVYVATYQGYLAALNLKTGHGIWRHKISAYAGIAADYQNVYVSDAKSHIWAFSEDSGTSLWHQTALQGRFATGPAIMGRYLVVADAYGYLHWLDKTNGTLVARNELRGHGAFTSPVVRGNDVYVYTSTGYLMAFRKCEAAR